jgi:hypothetical protein
MTAAPLAGARDAHSHTDVLNLLAVRSLPSRFGIFSPYPPSALDHEAARLALETARMGRIELEWPACLSVRSQYKTALDEP